ncbi:MAG: hypothetical protein IK079_02565, partial [Desulfovibrio sp.]|nr:hypothetical protein [Desulfovibrio sp.]
MTEILLALCVAVLVTAGMGTWIRYLGEEREATVLAQEMQNFVQLLQRYAENSPGEGDYSTQEGLPEAMTAFIHHTGRHYGMAIRRAVFGGEDVGQALFLFLEERVMPKRLLSKLRTKLSSGQKTVFFIGQAKTVDGALCLVADQGKLTLQHFSLSKVHEGMVVVCLLLFKHDVGADFLY